MEFVNLQYHIVEWLNGNSDSNWYIWGASVITVTYTLAEESGHNAQTVAVQMPSNTRVVKTILNQATSCTVPNPPGADLPGAGWDRVVIRGLVDQSGQDIQVPGQQVTEAVTPVAGSNGLNVKIQTSPADTDSSGQFIDTFSFCAPGCVSNPSATSTFNQTITDTSTPTANPLSPTTLLFTCNGIQINGKLTP